MTPWLDDGDVRLYHGDALEQLALMPSESVHCIVTSPPFWGLRDYGTGSWSGGDQDCDHLAPSTGGPQPKRYDGGGGEGMNFRRGNDGQFRDACGKCGARRVDQQIGLEETPDQWCARLVAVMREARRVLRSDGVCWIEVGDTYRSNEGSGYVNRSGLGGTAESLARRAAKNDGRVSHTANVKAKDLVGAPWLLAFALRADGWYLRSDTIWARPNPMPESVTDRPTKSHSYVFLLTKSARYFYDADAIREPHTPDGRKVTTRTVGNGSHDNYQEFGHEEGRERWPNGGRNARSVWTIPTQPTPWAHFATFPEALVERCIKAGTSEHGACSECGAPWRRVIEKGEPELRAWSAKGAGHVNQSGSREEGSTLKHSVPRETIAWEPSCACLHIWDVLEPDGMHKNDSPPGIKPCVVLDCFSGSGTTALVARRLGRHAIGIELNAEYLRISAERLQQPTLWSQPV